MTANHKRRRKLVQSKRPLRVERLEKRAMLAAVFFDGGDLAERELFNNHPAERPLPAQVFSEVRAIPIQAVDLEAFRAISIDDVGRFGPRTGSILPFHPEAIDRFAVDFDPEQPVFELDDFHSQKTFPQLREFDPLNALYAFGSFDPIGIGGFDPAFGRLPPMPPPIYEGDVVARDATSPHVRFALDASDGFSFDQLVVMSTEVRQQPSRDLLSNQVESSHHVVELESVSVRLPDTQMAHAQQSFGGGESPRTSHSIYVAASVTNFDESASSGLVELNVSVDALRPNRPAEQKRAVWEIQKSTVDRLLRQGASKKTYRKATNRVVVRDSSSAEGGLIEFAAAGLPIVMGIQSIIDINIELDPKMGHFRSFDIAATPGHDLIDSGIAMTTLVSTPFPADEQPSETPTDAVSFGYAAVIVLGGIVLSSEAGRQRGNAMRHPSRRYSAGEDPFQRLKALLNEDGDS